MSVTGPICVHPDNPHYLYYDGAPAVLITSAEHYGAVINGAFDYAAYFNMLARYGLNYTRIYPGAYFEVGGMFIEDNTLAPAPEDLMLPWARSGEPGYAQGGCKFDLERWDDAYFARFRDFLAQAERRGVIVEICLFNCQYKESWHAMAIQADNNIQQIGQCHYNDVQTLRDAAVVAACERYVEKITEEANPYDNVILEICDEPSLNGTSSAESAKWIGRLADVIAETERRLPKKHIIAQQLEFGVDFTEDSRVPLITTQYIYHNENRQIGGPEALDCLYIRNKPLELNETAFFPIWYGKDRVDASRIEAWEFMVGGGAAFNQLNGYFTAKDPSGDAPENRAVLAQLKVLKEFMAGLDIAVMRQDKRTVTGGVPRRSTCRCISNPGIQYALYLHHGLLNKNGLIYETEPGSHEETLKLNLPAGKYKAVWTNPASGKAIRTESAVSGGGEALLRTPAHGVDIALRIDRTV